MKKYILHGIIIVLTVLLFYAIQRCSCNNRLLNENTTALTDTVTYFKNGMGTYTASVKALQLDKKQLESAVIQKDSIIKTLTGNFSGVHTVVKYQSQIKLDTVYVAFNPADSLPPFTTRGAVFDKWYSFDYAVDNNGLALSNIYMHTETAVVTGIKRKWFLGPETLVADVANTNPYITVTGLNAAEVVLPTPWYKKWYVWLAAGTVAGFAVAH